MDLDKQVLVIFLILNRCRITCVRAYRKTLLIYNSVSRVSNRSPFSTAVLQHCCTAPLQP